MRKIFTAFVEHKEFQKSRPWSVVRQTFQTPVISTPHYAETTELLVCSGIVGHAYIGDRKYNMSEQTVLYVSPQTVHSFEHYPSDGYLLNIKFHPQMLKDFMDIEKILGEYGHTLADLAVVYEDFDAFHAYAENLADGRDVTEELSSILSIIRLLVLGSPAPKTAKISSRNTASGTIINEIIAWTEQNYSRKINLDEVAHNFGYNKSYFCDMFKARTGSTYLKYLNNVRISNACIMLRSGISVGRVSQLCGFETDSYFIQLFKKAVGITPKAYQTQQN